MKYQISEGPQKRAQRLLIYGPEGIGKSTMASMMPDPLFIDVEDGTGHLFVRRLPVPNDWDMLTEEVRFVSSEPDGTMTLVIDSVDAAERLCQQKVCQTANKPSIESWGYGKGYTIVAEKFRELLAACDRCINVGINVVLVAHSQMRKFERPDESGSYDRFEVKLDKRIASMAKEWADAVLFLDYETFVSVDENGKGKASGGKRVIRTSHHVSWDAKNRWGLPDKLMLDSDGITQVRENLLQNTPEQPTEQKPTEKRQITRKPKNSKGIPKAQQPLFALCERDSIDPSEVASVMVERGKREEGQAVLDWEAPFVEWVVSNWPRVSELVGEARKKAEEAETENVPF